MHPARPFHETDPEVLLAELAQRPFMALFAAPQGRLLVAHSPVLVRRLGEAVVLDFHLSRGNALTGHLADGLHMLAVGHGPDAYVSPGWYAAPDQVPTWNYVSVEAEGPIALLDDAGLYAILDDLSAQEEARLAPRPPWTRAKMSPGRFEAMARAVVGVRLTIERLEGTFKLSQNKPEDERARVADALDDHPLAARMR